MFSMLLYAAAGYVASTVFPVPGLQVAIINMWRKAAGYAPLVESVIGKLAATVPTTSTTATSTTTKSV